MTPLVELLGSPGGIACPGISTRNPFPSTEHVNKCAREQVAVTACLPSGGMEPTEIKIAKQNLLPYCLSLVEHDGILVAILGVYYLLDDD